MSAPSISIIGAGNIGSAVAGLAVKAGASAQVLVRDTSKVTGLSGVDVAEIGSPLTGDIVVLALPYAAIDDVIAPMVRRPSPARSSSTRPTPWTSPPLTPSCRPVALRPPSSP